MVIVWSLRGCYQWLPFIQVLMQLSSQHPLVIPELRPANRNAVCNYLELLPGQFKIFNADRHLTSWRPQKERVDSAVTDVAI